MYWGRLGQVEINISERRANLPLASSAFFPEHLNHLNQSRAPCEIFKKHSGEKPCLQKWSECCWSISGPWKALASAAGYYCERELLGFSTMDSNNALPMPSNKTNTFCHRCSTLLLVSTVTAHPREKTCPSPNILKDHISNSLLKSHCLKKTM